MRPSLRLLGLASLAAALSLAVVATAILPAPALGVPWALLGLAALVDGALATPGRRLALAAPPGREVFVGERATLAFRLSCPGRPGRASGPAQARLAWPDGLEGPPDFALAAAADGVAAAEVGVRALRRGLFPIGRVAILRASPLGLLDLVSHHAADTVLRVVPNLRAITSGEVDLQVAAATFGSKAAATRGEGSEFHQLREFVAGMDARAIDYKRSARHGALLVREMRAEQNHSIVLALDNGHLMREAIGGVPKIDHVIGAALALGWAAIQGGDLVGLYAFDARPRLFVPPERGRRTFALLRSRAAELEYRSVESNPTLALSHLQTRLRRRSLVVIFSDFVDTTTAELLVENIAVVRRHHVVLFVTLADPLLGAYARRPSRRLADVAEAVAAADLLTERRRVLDRLARLGVPVVEAVPGQLVAPLVSAYLAVKRRGLL